MLRRVLRSGCGVAAFIAATTTAGSAPATSCEVMPPETLSVTYQGMTIDGGPGDVLRYDTLTSAAIERTASGVRLRFDYYSPDGTGQPTFEGYDHAN